MWSVSKNKAYKKSCTNQGELRSVSQAAWDKIMRAVVSVTVESVPKEAAETDRTMKLYMHDIKITT